MAEDQFAAPGPVAVGDTDARVSEALAAQEAIIARGLKSFLEVSDALMVIRTDRLYLLTHTSFSAYCIERWGFSDSRAYQLTKAAEVVSTIVGTGLPAPATESQARELARVPERQRPDVWRETLERTGGQPTAAAIREVAAPVIEPKPVAPEPAPAAQLRPSKRDKATERVEAALLMYRECAPPEWETSDTAAVVALAAIEACGRAVDDATFGAIARAVIAEHRARKVSG